MADLTTPAETDAAMLSTATGHAIDKAGTGSWIVDGVDIAGVYDPLDETVLNAFNYNTTDSSGLDAVIDPGEAYVAGWLCRDTQTTVTLPADETVDVYLGYDESAVLSSGTAPADNENIIVGLDGDFAANDPRVHIWTFATDGSSIIDSLDERQLQKPIEFSPNSGLTTNTDLSVGGSLSVTGTATFNDTSTFNAGLSAGGDIDLNNNDMTDVRSLLSGDTGAGIWLNRGAEDLELRTGGESGAVRVTDTSAGEPIARFLEGGNVEMPDGTLEITRDNTQVRLFESDTSGQWNLDVSAGNLSLIDPDNPGWLRLLSDGDAEVPNGSISDSRGTAVVSGSEYEIQKNGSDTSGVINFKT